MNETQLINKLILIILANAFFITNALAENDIIVMAKDAGVTRCMKAIESVSDHIVETFSDYVVESNTIDTASHSEGFQLLIAAKGKDTSNSSILANLQFLEFKDTCKSTIVYHVLIDAPCDKIIPQFNVKNVRRIMDSVTVAEIADWEKDDASTVWPKAPKVTFFTPDPIFDENKMNCLMLRKNEADFPY